MSQNSGQRAIDRWLEAYGASHQNPINKRIHWVCVPAIYLSIVGLLWSVPMPAFLSASEWLNLATFALAPILLYYVRLSPALSIGMLLFSGACLGLVSLWDDSWMIQLWQASLAVFVVGWIGQFQGHRIEGVKPSFFEDIQFLMIGPAWLMSFIYHKVGIRY